MICLGEQIDEMKCLDLVVRLQRDKIAPQGDRVAGDINDPLRSDLCNELTSLDTCTGTRRVEHDKLGTLTLQHCLTKIINNHSRNTTMLSADALHRGTQFASRGRISLHGSHLLKAACEDAREETDTREKIPCNATSFVCADQLNHRWQEEAVHLEEAASRNPVGLSSNLVVEPGRTPVRELLLDLCGARMDLHRSGTGQLRQILLNTSECL